MSLVDLRTPQRAENVVALKGRCLCGSVTLRFSGKVLGANHCHCESCRRATSAPVTSFFTGKKADAVLDGEGLRFHVSSPGVRRGFCGLCGSPMSYETDTRPDEVDFYLASLDSLDGVVIKGHSHWSERVPWLNCADDLPKNL